MKTTIRILFFSVIFYACTKNTINQDTAGEIYVKYQGNYSATGSQIRYRVGIDTVTSVDTFYMTISKVQNTGLPGDSEFLDSKLSIDNFLGSGKTISANATYSQIYPFTSTALPDYKNVEINSETGSILNYSYFKINGTRDTSWFSGKATKL